MEAERGLKRTRQDRIKGTAGVQGNSTVLVRRLPKGHVDYWSSRVVKRTYFDRDRRLVEIPEWNVRFRKEGQQVWFNLGTANQAAAARKAKEIFTFLDANGWSATLAKFKPECDVAPK